MQFGLKLGNYGKDLTADRMLGLALAAERAGLDSVWVADHVVIPDNISSQYPDASRAKKFTPELTRVAFEPLTLLAVIAGMTRLRLGTSILVASQRQPLLLAKQLSTLDALSGGRVHLGVGAGWLREEFAALGVDFSRRWDRLNETIDILKSAWAPDPVISYSGSEFSFEPVHFLPKPAQAGGIPITVGGHGPRALTLAATKADGWNVFGVTAQQVKEGVAKLRQLATDTGRDPSELHIVMRGVLAPLGQPADPDSATAGGSPAQIMDVVRAYEAAGVTELTFSVADSTTLSEAGDILDNFAAARESG